MNFIYIVKKTKNSQDILDNYITKDIGQNVKENNDIQDVPVNTSTVFFCYFLLFFFLLLPLFLYFLFVFFLVLLLVSP